MRCNYPLRSANPFRGDRLRPLVRHEFSAAGLLLGADRSRILPELRPHRHRFLDGRTLADFFQPALYIRELVDLDLPGGPARRPGIADHVGNCVGAGGKIMFVEQTEVHDAVNTMCLIAKAAKGVGKIAVVAAVRGASEMALLAKLRTL